MSGSNRSNDLVVLNNVRVAGVRGDQPGQQFGGNFIPGYQKGDGSPVSSRFDTNLYINHPPRRDRLTGASTEVDPEIIRLVIWNSQQNQNDGKGQADNAAKILSLGKEITLFARIRSYLGQVYDNTGQPVNNPDGTPIKVRKIAFHLIPGSQILGADSDKQLAGEINTWLQAGGQAGMAGQIRFDARPQFWNAPGHPDQAIWKQVLGGRMAAIYTPGQLTFGYAKIVQPRGAAAVGYAGGLGLPSISPEGVAAAGGAYPGMATPGILVQPGQIGYIAPGQPGHNPALHAALPAPAAGYVPPAAGYVPPAAGYVPPATGYAAPTPAALPAAGMFITPQMPGYIAPGMPGHNPAVHVLAAPVAGPAGTVYPGSAAIIPPNAAVAAGTF